MQDVPNLVQRGQGLISLTPGEVLGILQYLADVFGIYRCEPGFAIANTVGNQQMLAVGMRGQPGAPLDPLAAEDKRQAHLAQYAGLVEPHPAMPIILLAFAQFCFVDQGKPAATCSLPGAGIEVDRWRATIELLGRDG